MGFAGQKVVIQELPDAAQLTQPGKHAFLCVASLVWRDQWMLTVCILTYAQTFLLPCISLLALENFVCMSSYFGWLVNHCTSPRWLCIVGALCKGVRLFHRDPTGSKAHKLHKPKVCMPALGNQLLMLTISLAADLWPTCHFRKIIRKAVERQLHQFLSFNDTKAISSQPNYLLAIEGKVLWLH